MRPCPACHKQLDDDLPFCVYCGTPLTPQLGEINNRYVLQELIGEGGMGEVFRAQDKQTSQEVALKIIRPELTHDAVNLERFKNETTALAAVNHPNLVRILEVGTDPQSGRSFFVMPYLRGPTVAEYLEGHKLTPAQAVDIAVAILQAVGQLHAHGWVHRDIKPQNVILIDALHPVLLDMGVARSLANTDTHLTMVGEVVGTPEAMAPEQITGGEITARTDIYQIGALLMHMLLGRPAFSANSTQSWYGMQMTASPVFDPNVMPLPVVQICLKALEKNPKDRYASARDMINALKPRGLWARLWGKQP